MTRAEAKALAVKVLRGDLVGVAAENAALELAAYIHHDGPDTLPAPPDANEVKTPPAPDSFPSMPPDATRIARPSEIGRPPNRGSVANFACCNTCDGEHHHCPTCGSYVRGLDILYCSTRCENLAKGVPSS